MHHLVTTVPFAEIVQYVLIYIYTVYGIQRHADIEPYCTLAHVK